MNIAKKDGKTPEACKIDVEFCSTRCMRKFLNEAIDELERRIEAAKPEIAHGKKKAGSAD